MKVETVQREGDEIRIRKANERRRYSFRQLMSQVTPENIRAEVKTGHPVGREAL
jgi:antitoxin component of MazEF toxin-antitoxin module